MNLAGGPLTELLRYNAIQFFCRQIKSDLSKGLES